MVCVCVCVSVYLREQANMVVIQSLIDILLTPGPHGERPHHRVRVVVPLQSVRITNVCVLYVGVCVVLCFSLCVGTCVCVYFAWRCAGVVCMC